MHALKYFDLKANIQVHSLNIIRMLLQLSHCNVPWLYGVQYDIKHPKAIAMSYHHFVGVMNPPLYIVHLKEMNFMRKYSTLIGKTYLQVEQLP